MTNQETLEFLQRYYESWGRSDPDLVASFFTADGVFEDLAFAAKFEGKDGVRSFVELTYAGVPDFKVVPTRVVVEGDKAAAAWTMTGTHSGDLPGLPATGKSFEVRASSIIVLTDGAISEIVDYWNPLEFKAQVGLA